MGGCCIDYPAAVYSETYPVARKAHRCGECGAVIQPGEGYQRIRGLWEGAWSGVKSCEKCADLRESLNEVWCCGLGELRDDYREYLQETGKARYDEILEDYAYPKNHLLGGGK